MNSLEFKMRVMKKIFVDDKLPRDMRRRAFRAYAELHAMRPPEVVRKMEQDKGLLRG